jgi:hypothetical protein
MDNNIILSTQIALKCIDPNLILSLDAVNNMKLEPRIVPTFTQEEIELAIKKTKINAEISIKEMIDIKKKYCTCHIIDKSIILKQYIRSKECVLCLEHDKHIEPVVIKEITRKDLLESEIVKLKIVKNEVKSAFITLLNTNPDNLHSFYNGLYNIQENVLNSDINRFTKELEEIAIS